MQDALSTKPVGQQLKTLAVLIDKRLKNELKDLNLALTGTQASVLILIFEHPDALMLQKQLEETLQLSHPTTRGIVKRLVANQLIATTLLADDRRQICLSLTAQGQALVATNLPAIKSRIASIEQELLRGFSPTEAVQMRQGLTRMLTNLID